MAKVLFGHNKAQMGHLRNGHGVTAGEFSWTPPAGNLLTSPNDFANAAWSKTRCIITSDQAVGPDGTTLVDLMTATGNDARLEQSAGDINDVHTMGVWVRSATGGNVSGRIDNAGLDTQLFTATNSWQQVETVLVTTGVVSPRLRVRITTSGDALYIYYGYLYVS